MHETRRMAGSRMLHHYHAGPLLGLLLRVELEEVLGVQYPLFCGRHRRGGCRRGRRGRDGG